MKNAFNYLFGGFWRGALFCILINLFAYFEKNEGMESIAFLYTLVFIFTQMFTSKIVKKIMAFIFNPWWRCLILILTLLGLALYFDDEYILFLVFILSIISMFYHMGKHKISIIAINTIIMFAIVILSFLGLCIKAMFPSHHRIKYKYSSKYEDQDEIEAIVGVELPNFDIIKSKLDESKGFNYEFTKTCNIEFEEQPDLKFYQILDSFCTLPIPDKIENKSTSFFYHGVESDLSCWNKDSNTYTFNKDFMFTNEKDHFFKLKITKGSKKAELSYGTF
jgi:hypothetical protein